jgi:phage-related protein
MMMLMNSKMVWQQLIKIIFGDLSIIMEILLQIWNLVKYQISLMIKLRLRRE